MKYPNIKKAGLSHEDIAAEFGFSNVKSFRSTSAHKRYMTGLDGCIGKAFENRQSEIDKLKKQVEGL